MINHCSKDLDSGACSLRQATGSNANIQTNTIITTTCCKHIIGLECTSFGPLCDKSRCDPNTICVSIAKLCVYGCVFLRAVVWYFNEICLHHTRAQIYYYCYFYLLLVAVIFIINVITIFHILTIIFSYDCCKGHPSLSQARASRGAPSDFGQQTSERVHLCYCFYSLVGFFSYNGLLMAL